MFPKEDDPQPVCTSQLRAAYVCNSSSANQIAAFASSTVVNKYNYIDLAKPKSGAPN